MVTKGYYHKITRSDINELETILHRNFSNYNLRTFQQKYPELVAQIMELLSKVYTPYEFHVAESLVYEKFSIAIFKMKQVNSWVGSYKLKDEKFPTKYKKFSIDITPGTLVSELITYMEHEVITKEKPNNSNSLEAHYCTSCVAALKKGQTTCEFCGTEYF